MRRGAPPERAARPGWLPPLLIVAAVAAAYANALGGVFQFDDFNVIVNEPKVASLQAWWGSMPGIRPLLKLSYAANQQLGGGVAAFHLTNVCIHALAALLAYALLLRWARLARFGSALAQAASLFGALLFALHPAQTEAVTYVSGRSASLSSMFALASIVAWIVARSDGRRALFAISTACFALALLVKETAAMVPLGILLWEWQSSDPAGSTPEQPRRGVRVPWAHVAVLAAALVVALAGPTYGHLLATSLAARGTLDNVATQASAVVYLAGQLVRFDRLNVDPALPVFSHWTPATLLDAAVLLGVLVIGLLAARRRHPAALGILWFFLWLAPTNSLLPRLDVANDRQLYLALLGPAWLLAWAAARLAQLGTSDSRPLRLVMFPPALALLVLLGAATRARNEVFANEILFWEDSARKAPHNGRAFNNLGYAYALAGRTEDAELAFHRALQLNPADARAGVNLRLLREGALPGVPR